MSSLPLPPKQPPLPTPPLNNDENSGELMQEEYGFILDAELKPKHRRDPSVIAFIDSFIRCKNIAQACDEAGIAYSLGYQYRHRVDIAGVMQKLIDRSTVKYGFDASEIMERTKEIVDFDPIMLQKPDGSFIDNMFEIPPEGRRSIKKFKAHNLYSKEKDINGIESKIIIGKVIEVEFYDKLKAVELVGKEKEMFKNTTRVEHAVTKDMASILLASAQRGKQASLAFNTKNIIETTAVEVDGDTKT